MGLNKAIQTCRINLGMTQKELATKAHLAEITIRKYESGERYPKTEQLKKIADALNVSVKDLHDLEFCYDNNITLEQLYNRESEIDKSGILLETFEKLNMQGQDKAIEHIEMLAKIPEYQREALKNYAEFVSDKTPEYWEGLKQTLQQIDADRALTSEPILDEERRRLEKRTQD